jgi:hypothetical protein
MTANDRASLLAILDDFIRAQAGGSDLGAMLAPGARATENGREVAIDHPFWRKLVLTPYRVEFADAAAGQVGCHATFQEGEAPGIVGLRMKVGVDRKISELEWTVARKGDSNAFAVHRLVNADPVFARVEPQRMPRERLIEVADAYFDAVEASDGTNAPIADDCARIENGMLTTNNPRVGLPWGCREGMKIFSYLERARDRRYPLVDEQRGLVWAIAAFDIPPGRVLSLVVDGKQIDRPQEERSIFLMELFKVVDGGIAAIDVVVRNMPPGASLGWATQR